MTIHDWRRGVNQFSATHDGAAEAHEYICTVCGDSRYASPQDPLPAGPCGREED